ncbi:type I-E CRISPR-associated protein Cas5/CasD [Parasaccharibacter apium]|nr:type I-E CRISPR-associated protein Cas5/CasD [Parasaccharibacter apium]
MSSYLVFSLAASLGAMGELAGHERRGSLLWPGRSALIGLMGAALGIPRDGDFSLLDALKIDVAIFASGEGVRDFHTIQAVPSAAVKKPNSRPEALLAAGDKVETSITLRDYRAGVFYGIAVQGEGLKVIEAALKKPCFTLYLGRKSCPLAAPPHPQIVEADTVEDALGHIIVPRVPHWFSSFGEEGKLEARTLVVDGAHSDEHAPREIVHDVPLDRQRWHFAAREVALRSVSIKAQIAEEAKGEAH